MCLLEVKITSEECAREREIDREGVIESELLNVNKRVSNNN